jgi:uncharacterized membrane protein
MDFVLWVSRVMHVISAAVWVGGLIFFNAILRPIAEHEQLTQTHLILEVLKRFQAFIWSSLWPLLVTGLLLMLGSRKFVWFDLSTWWLRCLLLKKLCFVLLMFFAWQMGKVVQQLPQEQKDFAGWWISYTTLVRRSIIVALIALLSAGGMMVL